MIGMLRAVHRAGRGVVADLGLYLAGAIFAGITAVASTLPAHLAWGQIAVAGYAVAAALAVTQLAAPARFQRPAMRAAVAGIGWLGATVVPLLVQAVRRAGGHPHRAQEEVTVVESGAARLVDTGMPYLTRDQIVATPEPLLGYLPYQPGMTVFGLPRALGGEAWWTDARIWFALGTAAAVLVALRLLSDAGVPDTLLIRAGQAVTLFPVAALTLATGGDDLPVLGLTLLALVFAARGNWTASGIAVGAAAAMKLFAWPVAAVLVVHAFATSRRAGGRLTVPALALPVAVLLPVVVAEPDAVTENLVRFPLGMGVVASPAASPLPGHLVATLVPGGPAIAAALLAGAAAAIGVRLLRRPPRTAATAAGVCAAGLLTAILLMPATRFGYLLYPAGYAVWLVALGAVTCRTGTGRPVVPSKST